MPAAGRERACKFSKVFKHPVYSRVFRFNILLKGSERVPKVAKPRSSRLRKHSDSLETFQARMSLTTPENSEVED